MTMKRLAVLAVIVPLTLLIGTLAWAAPSYQGVTIKVAYTVTPMFENPITITAKQIKAKFGINVELVGIPYEQLHDKMFLSLSSRSGDSDVYVYAMHWADEFMGGGYLEPLQKYIKDPSMTPASWDFSDWDFSVLKGSCEYKGTLYALPTHVTPMVLFYNKDLFAKGGISAPPKTWDEYLQIAKKLNNPDAGVYGNVIMAKQGIQISATFMSIFQSFGQYFYDTRYRPHFNTAQGQKSAQIFLQAMEYASPEVITYDFPEAQAAMQAGKAAMFIQWGNAMGLFDDPKASQVVGKIGVALMPAATVSAPPGGVWNMSICADSKKKDASWVFLRELTTKENYKAFTLDPAISLTSARKSISTDREVLAKYPGMSIVLKQMSTMSLLPRIPEYEKVLDVTNKALSAMATKQTSVADTLAGIDKDLAAAFTAAGYYK